MADGGSPISFMACFNCSGELLSSAIFFPSYSSKPSLLYISSPTSSEKSSLSFSWPFGSKSKT